MGMGHICSIGMQAIAVSDGGVMSLRNATHHILFCILMMIMQ